MTSDSAGKQRISSTKSSLWRNFGLISRIGLVAAGRDVEIVQQHADAARRESRRQMAAVGNVAEPAPLDDLDRPPGDGRHAVIALLAVDADMRIAQRFEGGEREQLVRALGFLQAQYVGRIFPEKALDDRQAQPHGVDVPCRDGQGHRQISGRSGKFRKLPAKAVAYKAAGRVVPIAEPARRETSAILALLVEFLQPVGVDLEQLLVELHALLDVEDHHRGVLALRIGDGPLPQFV